MRSLRLAVLVTCVASVAHAELSPAHQVAALQSAMRQQWGEHLFWVREAARATVRGESAAATEAEQEVVTNLLEMARSLEPFYGKAAGEKLFMLLNGQWSGIRAHARAVKREDQPAQEAALKALNRNADAIAAFFADVNPNLKMDAVRPMLLTQVGHHGDQDLQLMQKAYADEARTWQVLRTGALALADTLGEAIGKQFPEKLKDVSATR